MKKLIWVILVLMVSFHMFSPKKTTAKNPIKQQQISSLSELKLRQTYQYIQNLYVDSLNSNKVVEDAIKGMLSKLDPHSSYHTKEEVIEMNEPMVGNFDGIGISFNMLTDTIYVMEVISGGPSEKVGLRAGDKILYVDDISVAGVKKTNKEVISLMRGPKGTNVTIKVLRNGVDELIEYNIIRGKIPIFSIDASYMIDDKIGYIKVNRFAMNTADEFQDAIKKLKGDGMSRLIVDLTGNGGGYLGASTDMANQFFDSGKIIVYTQGANHPRQSINTNSGGLFKKGEVVVMVDEYSASASEILSGAVQDWDRGVVVGRRTFGKGLVQRQLSLIDSSMIRLTIASYYTPTGRCIQRPYETGDHTSYNSDIIKRYNMGELMHADSIHFPDSLRYETLVNKRTVYGGGGIMPDYFVPVATTSFTKFHRDLIAKGVVNRLCINEVDANREALLNRYPNSDTFKMNFSISDAMISKMKEMAKKENIEWNNSEYEKSKTFLLLQLKALIARDLYNLEAYLKIINAENDIFKDALDIIRDDSKYNSLLNPKR